MLPEISRGGIGKEDLPLPYVHYPPHYGTFFAFSETASSQLFLCECSVPAVQNFLALRAIAMLENNDLNARVAANAALHLPEELADVDLSVSANPLGEFRFRRAICHRCNLIPPTRRYCHEMYGVTFIQRFGWYVKQAYLRQGILPRTTVYLPDVTPAEFVEDIRVLREAQAQLQEAWRWFREREQRVTESLVYPERYEPEPPIGDAELWRRQDLLRDATRTARQAERVLSKKIENDVRQEFGHRKVGERWTSETLLYQIVAHLLPNREVIHHYRPDWLNGLELDIYVPSLALGFEYQGQQHFHAIAAWGGTNALAALQERDARKARLCKETNTVLITVDYTEPLTVDHIRDLIATSEAQIPPTAQTFKQAPKVEPAKPDEAILDM